MKKELPYCLMPWVHFHVGNGGSVKACCVANIPYGNINQEGMEKIWYGQAANQLRDKFAKGEKDNRCAQCFRLEEAGGKSIRQETFEKFGHLSINIKKPALPVYFDIRFSNVCNFRCRTCWHGASSKWFSDAKQLGTNMGEKAIIKNIDDFNLFIQKSGTALLQAKEIYFAGGEPLVTEEHYLLLKWLIKNGTTDIKLRYNTNFSTLRLKNFDVLKIWESFSEIELLASIDGTGSLGEYIRKEMDWELIIKNRKRIRKLPHVKFKLSPTISTLNIEHLPELYIKCLELNMIEPEDLYINILERPTYYNIQSLPSYAKAKVALKFQRFFERLNASPNTENVKNAFQECLDYMQAKDQSHHWPTFLAATKKLDLLRKESMPGHFFPD